MKKIISIFLIVIMLAGLQLPALAEPTGYVEEGYSFETVYESDLLSGTDRAFGITTYTVNNKDFMVVGDLAGFDVYNIDNPADPELIQSIDNVKIKNDGGYPLKAYKNKLYFSNSATQNTYIFDINQEDGTIAVEENGTALNGGVILNTRALYNMTFVDDSMIMLGNPSNLSTYGTDKIHIYDITDKTFSTSATYSTQGYAFSMNAVKKSDGLYRICFVSSDQTSAGIIADKSSIFNVVDYNPDTKEFTEVYRKVLTGSAWPLNPQYFILGDPVFSGETKITFVHGQDNKSAIDRSIISVDFSDLENIAVKLENSYTAVSGQSTRASFINEYDGKVMVWNNNTNIWDLSKETAENQGNIKLANGIRVTEVDIFKDYAFVVSDNSVKIIKITKSTLIENTAADTKRILNIGDVLTKNLVADDGSIIKPEAMAVSNAGDKKFAYIKDTTDKGTDNKARVRVFDITDFNNIIYKYTTVLSGSSAQYGNAMAVKDGYLIVGNYTKLSFYKIEDNGSLTYAGYDIDVGNNAIQKIEIVDDLLFALTGGKYLRVYNAKTLSARPAELAILSDAASEIPRGFTVEKISNMRYMLYYATEIDLDGTNKTLQFNVCELAYGLKGLSVTKRFSGTPDLSEVNVWPGRGIYGNDTNVPGYIGFSTLSSGELHVAGKGLIRFSLANINQNPDRTASDDIFIDVSLASAPKVVHHVSKLVAEYTPRQYNIDTFNILEQTQYGNASYIMNYDNPKSPAVKRTLTDFKGLYISVLDGVAYAAVASAGTDLPATIKAVEIFDDEPLSISDIIVTNEDGVEITTVEAGEITASIEVNNITGTPVDVNMFIAVYDKSTNVLEYVDFVRDDITGYKKLECTLDLASLSEFSIYSKYLKVFVWDNGYKPYHKCEAKIINAVEAEGTSYNLWLPEGVGTVEGLIVMHEHGMAGTLKEKEVFKNFLSSLNMGYLTIAEPSDGILKAFENPDLCGGFVLHAISEFAASTGHPELVNVPLATLGHSNGTKFAAGFAAWSPERIFAAVAYKPGTYKQFELYDNSGEAKLKNVPVMAIEGELDLAYGAQTHNIYEAVQRLREKDALIHYVIDPNAGHGTNDWRSNTIVFSFLKEAFEERVPENANPLSGAVQLNNLDKNNGYIGNIETTLTGVQVKADNNIMTEDKEFSASYASYSQIYPSQGTQVTDGAWLISKAYADKWVEFVENGIITGVEYK